VNVELIEQRALTVQGVRVDVLLIDAEPRLRHAGTQSAWRPERAMAKWGRRVRGGAWTEWELEWMRVFGPRLKRDGESSRATPIVETIARNFDPMIYDAVLAATRPPDDVGIPVSFIVDEPASPPPRRSRGPHSDTCREHHHQTCDGCGCPCHPG
jgi:hypothetical protein